MDTSCLQSLQVHILHFITVPDEVERKKEQVDLSPLKFHYLSRDITVRGWQCDSGTIHIV